MVWYGDSSYGRVTVAKRRCKNLSELKDGEPRVSDKNGKEGSGRGR